MSIKLVSKGNFNKTEKFLKFIDAFELGHILNKYGQIGMNALASATPVDSGKTASLWDFKVEEGRTESKITWYNHNVNNGVNIAIILQYGHGTGTGGYVVGRDYINPAIQPIFDSIAEAAWMEVTNA